MRAVENSDCKKNYVWKDHDDSQSWGGLKEAFQESRAVKERERFLATSDGDGRGRRERYFSELERAAEVPHSFRRSLALLEIWAENGNGERVTTGEAEVYFSGRQGE